jgi:multimeric flavodoxin WrbA
MILGISASGRKNRIVSQTVKAILEETRNTIRLIFVSKKKLSSR